ncbi:hypothetical protein MTsPCn9_17280 [Croceitalea sp. MTPC9]|uniref:DinB family protein n=1 Tax=unclassified Croceitalea TaxID=2632280 RepID=UPI002B3EC1BF|nr:hypothetical protein MTsPCn6_10130 [Croceitalea sp. MTPC6]GMN16792.1 hypothetical protein MTsPCn9_17280 [Croceitalea sp. MTPC9]
MNKLLFLPILFFTLYLQAQDMKLPYHQIPDYPEDYGSGNLVSRMIDGLGYRYYWATEGLTVDDLNYKPSENGRTTLETLQHLYGLSLTIVNAPENKPNVRPMDFTIFSYKELREKTLFNLKKASELSLGKTAGEIESFKVIFQRGDKQFDFPFWNMLNGPIADAIYHTGQIVVLRRASGNPVNPGMNVFTGKTKEN